MTQNIFRIYILIYDVEKKLKITFSPKTVIMGLDFNTDFLWTDTVNVVIYAGG